MRIVKTDLIEAFTRCPSCKTRLAYTEEDVLLDLKYVPHLNYFDTRETIRCCYCGDWIVLNEKYVKDFGGRD
jgi:uncharacterized protein with PIN domain